MRGRWMVHSPPRRPILHPHPPPRLHPAPPAIPQFTTSVNHSALPPPPLISHPIPQSINPPSPTQIRTAPPRPVLPPTHTTFVYTKSVLRSHDNNKCFKHNDSEIRTRTYEARMLESCKNVGSIQRQKQQQVSEYMKNQTQNYIKI